ncbi:MAG TPA: hypothetical protein DE315_07165 [Candidatus Omnitrophica bacterium]|nr:hypothetical protein [Candidatus Omnitrophota bacterium]HCI45291.1 hypothetical protein [Candidatus Omnitrophota bacterium]
MQSIQKIKEEMYLNVDMAELMEVLKGIAISEFWALAKKQGRFARFMKAFDGFFDIVDFHQVRHPMATGQGKLALLMVTSNEGFMGGLNTRVINAALANPEADAAEWIIVGEQGANQLAGMNKRFKAFPGVVSEECYDASVQLRDHIMQETRKGAFGRLTVYYPKSVSFMVQRVEEVNILPCRELFQKKGKTSAIGPGELIIESSLQSMIQYLVETWIVQRFYEILEDSKLAEFSARTVHLEESFQLLQERGKGIRFQYLRSWHELIDKGMRDIFSAQSIRRKARKVLNMNVSGQ